MVTMDLLARFFDYIVSLDVHLTELIAQLDGWVYVIISALIFAETGLVVAPWLPGESLLITSGTLAGTGLLNIAILAPCLLLAAFLGDLSAYAIGRFIGSRLTRKPRRFIKPEHVAATELFFARHGGVAIVLARFMPVIRSLALFVAGVARMPFKRLVVFAALAETLWVTIFLSAGYFFGNIPWVKDNLALALFLVVLVALLPSGVLALVRWVRSRRR